MDYASETKAINRRWGQLKKKRESNIGPWMELTKFFTPDANPYLGLESQVGQSDSLGNKKHQHLYDNSPLAAVDVATAGLVSGMASPARPWFRIQTPDKDLNQVHSVRVWLSRVEDILRDVYAESNTYRTFRSHYESLLVIGTSASLQYPDFHDVVRHFPLSAGEYAISTDYRGKVDTLYRNFAMTADQMVGQFGLKNCSAKVQAQYEKANYSSEFDVLHAIEPRRERDPMKLGGVNMPFKSCYLEIGDSVDKYLNVSGFNRFPALVPRWKVNGRNFYGESPARRAIGDAMQLQHEQYRKAQAIDFETQPALAVPSSLTDAIMRGPGALNVVDSLTQGVKPLWEVSLNLANLLLDLQDVRRRVDKAMFVDVFLLFSRPGPGIQPKTAEEIAELSGEKLLMAGPILENLHDELLAPDIEMKFAYALEAGILPPPPPELHGKPLVIKFVSTLAQAQRLIGLNQVDRMLGTIVNLAAVKPNVLDKLDSDAVVDMYSDVLGVDPSMIVAGDKVALIRQQRAQAEAAQTAAAAAPEAAQTAKTLGETNIGNANAAVRALSTLGGTP